MVKETEMPFFSQSILFGRVAFRELVRLKLLF